MTQMLENGKWVMRHRFDCSTVGDVIELIAGRSVE